MIDRKESDVGQEVLGDLLNCNSACGSLGVSDVVNPDNSRTDLDYLMDNLPGIDYVCSRMVNYIFSNGLTTGDPNKDVELDEWLYEARNLLGASNYHVLREAIHNTAIQGECGLRMFDGNLYLYKKGTYGILIDKHDGITEIVGFFIKSDGKTIDAKLNEQGLKLEDIRRYDDVADYFKSRNLIFLSNDEFVNMRNDTSSLQGYCPLLKDKLRIGLLLSVYERLNYDIEYDGPGRIIVRPKDGYVEGDENDISSGTVLNSNVAEMYEEAKKEIKRVAKEIKDSSSDSVIGLSNAFSKEITHLPRVTKATEFFSWIKQEGVILAETMGMSPTLLEVGDIHGNVSVEKIIDNAMLNTIIPMRETYAVQFSDMVAKRLGVPKVYFNKYDLQQVEDENMVRERVSNIINKLALADKYLEGDDENVKKLTDEFTEYLRTSIYDSSNKLRSM